MFDGFFCLAESGEGGKEGEARRRSPRGAFECPSHLHVAIICLSRRDDSSPAHSEGEMALLSLWSAPLRQQAMPLSPLLSPLTTRLISGHACLQLEASPKLPVSTQRTSNLHYSATLLLKVSRKLFSSFEAKAQLQQTTPSCRRRGKNGLMGSAHNYPVAPLLSAR